VKGDLSGQAPVDNSVVLGDGVVPWEQVLAVAREQQVEDYFIEDESTSRLRKKAAFLMHNSFGSGFSDGFCCYIALFLCPANRFGDCRDTTA
jgi:hypothetical protein